MKDLILEYNKKRKEIKERLKEFRDLHRGKDEDIFSELCFCILTPQSKAVNSDRAIKELKKSGLLFKGNRRVVRTKLKGVRFPNNKSAFLISARKVFKNGKGVNVKCRLNPCNTLATREWLVKNVKGLGYKEASHFLRNIGLGRDLAILDVHILKNLKRYKVIEEIPQTLGRKAYLNTENRMKDFSRKINIPIEELDLLFWSKETGLIFK